MKTKKSNKVIELFISKKGFDSRIKQSEISVDLNGVFVDKYYGKDINRSVLITSLNSYDIVANNNIEIHYGQLGENILIDFDLNYLPVGTEIQIGKATLEITAACTICDSLSKIDARVPKLLEHDRGIFAQVIKNGIIQQNDIVTIIKN